MKRLRSNLTYANVMATVAVFVALGGASYAAVKLPKNSVGSKQIKKNAITSAKIKANAVTASKIAPGAVPGASINTATLGTVPSATNAAHATTADSAANLGGLPPSAFARSSQVISGRAPGSSAAVQILSVPNAFTVSTVAGTKGQEIQAAVPAGDTWSIFTDGGGTTLAGGNGSQAFTFTGTFLVNFVVANETTGKAWVVECIRPSNDAVSCIANGG